MESMNSPFLSRRRMLQLEETTTYPYPSSDLLLMEEAPSLPSLSSSSLTNTPPSIISSTTTTRSSKKSSSVSGLKYWLVTQWHKWQRKVPCLKRIQESVLRVPPRIRVAIVVFWFGWKLVLLVIFLVILIHQSSNSTSIASLLLLPIPMTLRHPTLHNNLRANATKVLYIVTTLAEYNSGRRKTRKGSDRFLHQLLPVMMDSVETMVMQGNLQVDVFLICAYPLQPEREAMIRYRLPIGVGFQFWDNALPFSYPNNDHKESINATLTLNTRALARQHRYVIKDKLEYYDMFVAFEDDMLVRGAHVEHYYRLSQEIEILRVHAPETLVGHDQFGDNVDDYQKTKFFGSMTKHQLERVVPGFVRVEVIVNDTDRTAKNSITFPVDYDFAGQEQHIDPSICCELHMDPPPLPEEAFPETPSVNDLIVWETNILAFSLRQFPPGSSMLDWAVLMMGPGKKLDRTVKIGGYWSGREGDFRDVKHRPSGGEPKLVAQQGGWMATQEQLIRMHLKLCLADFLPPFDNIAGHNDGLDPHNVEFWSGSYQFFTGAGNHCNMQRIISMHPDHFSKHLLYHTANNKQKQLTQRRMLRADQLFGQLNKVRKMAETAQAKIIASNNKI